MPVTAAAHETVNNNVGAPLITGGFPSYYSHLLAGDTQQEIHKKGTHPLAGQQHGGDGQPSR